MSMNDVSVACSSDSEGEEPKVYVKNDTNHAGEHNFQDYSTKPKAQDVDRKLDILTECSTEAEAVRSHYQLQPRIYIDARSPILKADPTIESVNDKASAASVALVPGRNLAASLPSTSVHGHASWAEEYCFKKQGFAICHVSDSPTPTTPSSLLRSRSSRQAEPSNTRRSLPCQQLPPPTGQLVFDGSFEGGNISAIQRSEDGSEYEVILRSDSLNSRYRLWFHFTATNALPGQQVLFSIVNFSKGRSLFRHGMSPVVRSAKRPSWHRVPAKNTYYYKSAKHSNRYVMSFAFVFDQGNDKYEFAYSFPFTYTSLQYELGYLEFIGSPCMRRQLIARTPQLRRVDAVIISQPLLPCPLEGIGMEDSDSHPLHSTHQRTNTLNLTQSTSSLSTTTYPVPPSTSYSRSVSFQELRGQSAGSDTSSGTSGQRSSNRAAAGMGAGTPRGPSPSLYGAVSNNGWSGGGGKRPVVFITSRVHPGETPASYVAQGLLAFLLGSDPRASSLRSAITWVVVPMLNPDGVFLGNYRTDAGGVDLNRMWLTPAAPTMPALHHSLRLLKAYHDHPSFQVDFFIDIHAHSTSRRSFMFCNKPPSSSPAWMPPANLYMDPTERVTRLPKIMSNLCPSFSLQHCLAEDSAVKASCARRVAATVASHAFCYTLEVSFFHNTEVTVLTQPGDASNVDFSNTIEGYMDMGKSLALSFFEYYGLTVPAHMPSQVLQPSPQQAPNAGSSSSSSTSAASFRACTPPRHSPVSSRSTMHIPNTSSSPSMPGLASEADPAAEPPTSQDRMCTNDQSLELSSRPDSPSSLGIRGPSSAQAPMAPPASSVSRQPAASSVRQPASSVPRFPFNPNIENPVAFPSRGQRSLESSRPSMVLMRRYNSLAGMSKEVAPVKAAYGEPAAGTPLMLVISGKSGGTPSTIKLLGNGQVAGGQAAASSSSTQLSGEPLMSEGHPVSAYASTQQGSSVNAALAGLNARRSGDVKQQPISAPGIAASSATYALQPGGRIKSAAVHSKRFIAPQNR